MWLRQWMTANGWTEQKLGDQISVSAAYAHRLKTGQNFPGRDVRRRIHEVTAGQVTANDLAEAHDAYSDLPPVRPRVVSTPEPELAG